MVEVGRYHVTTKLWRLNQTKNGLEAFLLCVTAVDRVACCLGHYSVFPVTPGSLSHPLSDRLCGCCCWSVWVGLVGIGGLTRPPDRCLSVWTGLVDVIAVCDLDLWLLLLSGPEDVVAVCDQALWVFMVYWPSLHYDTEFLSLSFLWISVYLSERDMDRERKRDFSCILGLNYNSTFIRILAAT